MHAGSPPRATPTLRALSSFNVQPTNWLMPGRIPYGHVTILGGPQGEGKSTLTMAMAAEVTRKGMATVLVGSEDDPATGVRPRFQAAGGIDEKLYIFGHDAEPSFPEDTDHLEEAVRSSGAGLLIVDPIQAHLSPMLNTNNDHSLRQGLRPLARLAQRTKVAVVLVMHLNKGREGSPLNWLAGSGGFSGIARSALLFGCLKSDAEEMARKHVRYLFHVKSNLSSLAAPLGCTIEGATLDTPEGPVFTSRLAFGQEDPAVHPMELR